MSFRSSLHQTTSSLVDLNGDEMSAKGTGALAPSVNSASAQELLSNPAEQSLTELTGLLANLQPISGKLQPIRTKAEAEAGLKLIDAHIVCIQACEANNAVKLIDAALPPGTVSHLQHLRRVSKAINLPAQVKSQLDASFSSSDEQSPLASPAEEVFPRSLSQPARERTNSNLSLNSVRQDPRPPSLRRPSTSSSSRPSSKGSSSSRRRRRPKNLYLVACPIDVLTASQVSAALAGVPHATSVQPVPSTAPSTLQEAQQWSADHWPTVYKAHNPFGPQPVFVAKAQGVMEPLAAKWMKIVQDAAKETHLRGYGEEFGALIIDPRARDTGIPSPVALAGDARWKGDLGADNKCKGSNGCSNGNPAAHAAMRAIGMVAKQRVKLAESSDAPAGRREQAHRQHKLKENMKPSVSEDRGQNSSDVSSQDQNKVVSSLKPPPSSSKIGPSIFHDSPITPMEGIVFNASSLPGGGYLCSGLEIWLSHEPCVMCCMALLHSRFERVVFGKRMIETGGLSGEKDGLNYGLFWRTELNWKMAAWTWEPEDQITVSNAKDSGIQRERPKQRKVHV